MARKLKIYASGALLLFLSSPLRAQQETAAPQEEPSLQMTEEAQRKLQQAKAELEQRKAAAEQKKAELEQRRTELVHRKVELAHRQVELAQRQVELAERRHPLHLFSPERIMQHQQELGLTESQKQAIKAESQNAQAQFSELQKQLEKETETMASLVKAGRLDEPLFLAQLDRILTVEREIKRNQLALAIRIGNKLTHEQQARLEEVQQAQVQQAKEKLEAAIKELEQKKLQMESKPPR